jgi:PIN domain nuclease of toxin-antitoxin system
MVLDASAVLAFLMGEYGATQVEDAIDAGALLSSINLAEIMTRLVRDGIDPEEARQILSELPVTIVPFGGSTALAAGALLKETRALGLSLGDRACLALAREQGRPALTADQAWTRLPSSLGISVHLIR